MYSQKNLIGNSKKEISLNRDKISEGDEIKMRLRGEMKMNKVRSRYIQLMASNIILLVAAVYTRFKYLDLELLFIDYVILTSMASIGLILDLRKAINKYTSED